MAGDNEVHTPADEGFFSYGGGHYQKYAVDLGLGALGNPGLAAEIEETLGGGIEVAFAAPQPAGGMRMTPAQYAHFLRAILAGDLAIAGHLGAAAVCTLPAACESARYSPVPYAWHYSYGHWVEDDPDTGDGTFSSAGAFGFYPWIDASKSWYGIVARKEIGAGAGVDSADCGRAIRRAFMTGDAG
jgi:CubicO group peptidase (beta-lactamase class C family)